MAASQRTRSFGILAALGLAGCSWGSTFCNLDSDCVNGAVCVVHTCEATALPNRPDTGFTLDAGPGAYFGLFCSTDLDCGGTDSVSGVSSNGNYCECGTCATACISNADCPGSSQCVVVTNAAGTPIGTATACEGSCLATDSGTMDVGPIRDGGPADSGPGGCALDAGYALCNGTCVNTTSDPENCSACGMKCAAGDSCSNSTCECATPSVLCVSTCVDTLTNPANCGGCGKACGAGWGCDGGACTCPAADSMCGTSCVDEMNDSSNCGSCGMVCSTGLTCTGGSCQCATMCSGACKNLTNDFSNCGTCGNVCPSGSSCVSSTCKCGGTVALCENFCPDYQNDPENCGRCGNSCGVNEQCNSAFCECVTNDIMCPTGCTDLKTDHNNCGGCGYVCNANQFCSGGSCS